MLNKEKYSIDDQHIVQAAAPKINK